MASKLEFINSINSTTTNVSTVSFDNIFSDKYDVYYLNVKGYKNNTNAEELAFRLIDSSGSALTGSNYTSPSYTLQTGGSFSEVRDVNQATGQVSATSNFNNFTMVSRNGTADQTVDAPDFSDYPTAS